VSLQAGLAVGRVRWLLTAATLVSACAVIALHAPGHVSMDSSIQLHEAHVGTSVSWNPPFMSALMRWLGGGELATGAIVLLQVLMLYGGTLLAADVLLRQRERAGTVSVALWAVLLTLAVVLNPVVALYAGIVWKDVLFASFLVGGASLGLAALAVRGALRLACAAGAVLVLAASVLTRQQGVFMAPVLVLILLAGRSWRSPVWRWIALATAFAAAVLLLQHRVGHTVRDSGSRSTSVGFRSIMIFDMMGIVARTQRPATDLAMTITPAQFEAVRRVYQPSRIDYIANDPIAESWIAALDPSALRAGWWALVKQDPVAWLRHRAAAYATLMGLHGIAPTQPMHIGVDGNLEYLREVGLQERRGPRDLLVWRLASGMFGWPIWRHVFWLTALVTVAAAWSRRPASPWRRASGCIIAACALFYASFVPTMISSDFRYLFGAIPLVGLLVLLLALAPPQGEVTP
jgi:hypothetical protein